MDIKLSYPATRIFLECAKKYEYIFVEQRPVPVTPSLYLEGTVHVALSLFYQRQIEGHPMDERECEGYFSDAHVNQIWLRRIPAANGVAMVDEKTTHDAGIALLRLYFRWAEKSGLRPVYVERHLEKTAGDLTLTGRIDAMDSSGIAIDWKVPPAPWSQERIRTDLQPLFYALLLGHPLEFHYHFMLKEPTPQIRWAQRKVSQQAMDWAAQDFLPPIAEAIRSGSFPYADPTSEGCGAGRCPYWSICKGGASRPV